MKLKIRKRSQIEYLYLIVYALYSYIMILNTSLINIPSIVTVVKAVCLALLCFMSIVILLRRRFSLWLLVIIAGILILFSLVTIISGRTTLLFVAFFIFCASLVDFRAIVMTSLFTDIIALLTLLFTIFIGAIPNYTVYRDGMEAMCLGFDYYSYFPFIVLYITIMYLYLRGEKIKWLEFLALFAIMCVVYALTTVRVAFYVDIIVLLLDAYLLKIRKKEKIMGKSKLISALTVIAFPVELIVLFGSTVLYLYYKPTFLVNINSWLNGRLRFNAIALQRYPITLFGRELSMSGASASEEVTDYFYVDSGLFYALITYGIFFTIIAIIIYSYMFRKSYKSNDKVLFIWIFSIWVFSLINNTWITISYNPLILFFGCNLFMMRRQNLKVTDEKFIKPATKNQKSWSVE